MVIFSIFFIIKVCCVYLLESPNRGDSKYIQQRFSRSIKRSRIIPNIFITADLEKNLFGLKGWSVVRWPCGNFQTRASYNSDDSRARAYCACSRCGWGLFGHFTLLYPFSPLSPSLWETARFRLKYCLKRALNLKQPTNQIQGLKNGLEIVMVNKPSVIEPSKFVCIFQLWPSNPHLV